MDLTRGGIVIIGRRFTFCASHTLPNHKGKCKDLHGHNYVLEVEIIGPIQLNIGPERGMILDYTTIDTIVQANVIERLDHTHLNPRIPNPTAENISTVIVEWLSKAFNSGGIRLHSVKLWETERAWAFWKARK